MIKIRQSHQEVLKAVQKLLEDLYGESVAEFIKELEGCGEVGESDSDIEIYDLPDDFELPEDDECEIVHMRDMPEEEPAESREVAKRRLR